MKRYQNKFLKKFFQEAIDKAKVNRVYSLFSSRASTGIKQHVRFELGCSSQNEYHGRQSEPERVISPKPCRIESYGNFVNPAKSFRNAGMPERSHPWNKVRP